MSLKVIIADDHSLVRQGLRQYLEMDDEIEVVGEASKGSEVLTILDDAAAEAMPDVVVLDARMPESDGLDTARQIKVDYPDVAVVMLSAYDDPELVTQSLRWGARAYVLKNKSVEYLIETIHLVSQGSIVIDPDLGQVLAESIAQAKDKPRGGALTTREMEVLQLLAFGHTNKEVAAKLFISPDTVKAHLEHVFAKLGVSDRAAAVASAFRRGLVE